MSVTDDDPFEYDACPACERRVYYFPDEPSLMCACGERVAVGDAEWYLALRTADDRDVVAGGYQTYATARDARDAAEWMLNGLNAWVAIEPLFPADARERAR